MSVTFLIALLLTWLMVGIPILLYAKLADISPVTSVHESTFYAFSWFSLAWLIKAGLLGAELIILLSFVSILYFYALLPIANLFLLRKIKATISPARYNKIISGYVGFVLITSMSFIWNIYMNNLVILDTGIGIIEAMHFLFFSYLSAVSLLGGIIILLTHRRKESQATDPQP